MRARDLAILAGAIALYDLMATGFLPLTTDMIERLSGMPFLPMAAWPAGSGQWAGIDLGDLLMAPVGPLVMRKAFGRTAGIATMAIARRPSPACCWWRGGTRRRRRSRP